MFLDVLLIFVAASLFEASVIVFIMQEYILRKNREDYNRKITNIIITNKRIMYVTGWLIFFSFCLFRIAFV